MTTWKANFERWNNATELDASVRQALNEIKDNPEMLEDCFYTSLEFGTGGMRGELGPGTNRMNIYTIRKAALGFGQYIASMGEEAKERGVVIAYDSRYQSREFALESALTLANLGIRSYVFSEIRPTPELSFAVRERNAIAGIVITASHNPKQYNGFKVYNEDGGQLPPKPAKELLTFVNAIENELQIDVMDEQEAIEKGYLHFILHEEDDAYIQNLTKVVVQPDLFRNFADQIKVVYTPLHGAGYIPLVKSFEKIGVQHVIEVKEQTVMDPNFSTVPYPNPEEKEAFTLAMEYGKKADADLLLATDPDSDRLGVAVRTGKDTYELLTGNQLGALFLDYLLTYQDVPENAVMIKTIVTSEFGRAIADAHHVKTLNTLTGFKFIGEKIREFEQTGEYQFIFGYEESYGYLIRDFARDKDAIQAAILATEMCLHYKQENKTLVDRLYELYEQFGYYKEGLDSFTLTGVAGAKKIQQIMDNFRTASPKEIGGRIVVATEDYQTQQKVVRETGETVKLVLPSSNVIKFLLDGGEWVCLRPSGTEPKIKCYYGVKELTEEASNERLMILSGDMKKQLQL